MAQDYRIVREERISLIQPGNVPSQGYRVWFEIPATRTFDYIDVGEQDHNPAMVKELIEDKVKTTLSIFGL